MCLIFNGLDSEVFLADERKKMKETLEFFITSSRRLSGTVGLFHLCEFLNLANIIFQVKSQLNSSVTVLSIIFRHNLTHVYFIFIFSVLKLSHFK
jgi:hypothetical protein